AYVAGGVVPYRMGNAHPSVFPYEPLPTADDDIIIAAANDRQFRKLCEVLGIPEGADDPRFARNADRTTNREELRPLLVERLKRRGAVEWFDELVAVGVPCGPIQTIDGGFAMAERFGLDPIVEVGEGERAMPATRHPIRFSATPASYRLPSPELDERGAELRTWLSARREDRAACVPRRARRVEPSHDHAAGPGPGRGRGGHGRFRRAVVLARHAAAPLEGRDAGVRGRPRRARRPRVHP